MTPLRTRSEHGATTARKGREAAGTDPVEAPDSGLVARCYPLAQKALLLVPLLAIAGPFASVKPGAAGFPYFYRILFVLGLVVAVPLFVRQLRRRVVPLAFTVMFLVWLVWAPITLLWSPDRATGRTEVLAGTLAMLGAWVVLMLTRGRSTSLRYLRWGWLICFAVTMVVVLWEFQTGRHLGEVTGVQDWIYSAYSVAGLDTNPNGLSNYLIAIVAVVCAQLIREVGARRTARMPIEAFESEHPVPVHLDGELRESAYPRRTSRGKAWRVPVLLLALVMAGYSVYLTGSRAGILSLMVLLVLAALWCMPTGRRRLVVPIGLLLIAAALPVVQRTELNTFRPKIVQEQAKHEPTSGHYQDNISDAKKEEDVASADKLRKDLTLLGVRYLKAAPVQGHGAGAALTLVRNDPDYEPGVDEKHRHVLNLHDTFLEIGVNYGLVGLLPILAVPLLSLGIVLRPRQLRRWWPDPVVYECLGILLATLITSIITSTSIGTPSFWLLMAYAGALAWNYLDATRAADRATTSDIRPATDAPSTPTPRDPKASTR